MQIKLGIPPKINGGTVALDLEIFRANTRQLHRPSGEFACLSICDGQTVWVIDKSADVEKSLQNVTSSRWVMHNAAFDIPYLRQWADIPPRPAELFWDSFLIERILWNGFFDDFGLDDLARRYLNLRLPKEERKSFYEGSELSDSMIRYAAADAWVTRQIHDWQVDAILLDPQLWSVWTDIDAPAFWAVQDFKGLRLDIEKWTHLAERAEAKASEIRERLGFNPGSPIQVKRELAKLGIKLESTAEQFLIPYKDNKIVSAILEYREATKLAGTYGLNMLDYVEADGRIHSGYVVTGAVTGRMASHDPNAQNVPRSHEYRACFIAEDGNDLIIADVAAQEPKIGAEVTMDPMMLQTFERGLDIHWEMAKDVFHLPKDMKPDKDLRRRAKIILLGMMYGLTKFGLAKQLNCSVEDAESHIESFFASHPRFRMWIPRQRDQVYKDGLVRTLSGRRQAINPNNWQWQNHALNTVVQGTAADEIKLALGWLHLRYGKDLPVDAVVHDEIIAECPTRLTPGIRLDIIRAFSFAAQRLTPHVTTKGLVDVHIGKCWADKEG